MNAFIRGADGLGGTNIKQHFQHYFAEGIVFTIYSGFYYPKNPFRAKHNFQISGKMIWNIVIHNLTITQELHWKPEWNVTGMFIIICPLLMQSLAKLHLGFFCNSLTITDQLKQFSLSFPLMWPIFEPKSDLFERFNLHFLNLHLKKLWIYQYLHLQVFKVIIDIKTCCFGCC